MKYQPSGWYFFDQNSVSVLSITSLNKLRCNGFVTLITNWVREGEDNALNETIIIK